VNFERVIGVGDIHGCVHTLIALLEQVNPTERDLFIFTGDYVDRGLHTFDVIQFLIGFKEKFPQTIFIKGNHEDLFMKHLDGDFSHRQCFFYNGGWQTVNSYLEVTGIKPYEWKDMPVDHTKFLNDLEPAAFVDTGAEKFIFVHGGLRPGIPFDDQSEHDLTWIRDEFLWSRYDFGATVVHGHTPMEDAEMEDYHRKFHNKINLDSGCVYGYKLTAVDVLTREEWEQPLITKDTKRGIH
jgi:serine/threonine protein phosphatase 1